MLRDGRSEYTGNGCRRGRLEGWVGLWRAQGARKRGRYAAALAKGVGPAALLWVSALTGCPVDDRDVELTDVQGLFPVAADGGVVLDGAANTTTRELGVPALAVSAESFEWGPLPTGFGGTKVLRISNTGNGVMSRPLVNLAEPVDPALSLLLQRERIDVTLVQQNVRGDSTLSEA
jgi:hypothetical protein